MRADDVTAGARLFARAILQSNACVGDEDAPSIASREVFGRKLADALHCKQADPAAELACMRGKTDDEVMTAIPLAKVLNDDDGVGYRFVTDGVVLPVSPAKAMASGAIAKIPVLLGTTDDEMGRYIVAYKAETAGELRAVFEKEWPNHGAELAAKYPVTAKAGVRVQMAAAFSDWANTCPIRGNARTFSKLGSATYLYRFRHAPDVFGDRSHGAFHGSELAYLFPSVFLKHKLVYRDDDRAIAALMSGYWARFAATGDPNGGGAPVWPRYDATTEQHLTIDTPATTSAGAKLRAGECELWDRIPD